MSGAGGGSGAAASAPAAQAFYQLYRRTTLGNALFDALDELVQAGHINPQLAVKVLTQFDKSSSTTFSSKLSTKCSAKSRLQSYRLVEEVWTFVLDNPTFKLENNSETLAIKGKVKVVACKGQVG